MTGFSEVLWKGLDEEDSDSMTDESGSDGTEDDEFTTGAFEHSLLQHDDSSPLSTPSDVSQRLTPSEDHQFFGRKSDGKTQSKSSYGGLVFWLLLLVCSSLPGFVVLNQYCQDGRMDTGICITFQSVAHSVARALPGMHCLGGGGGGDKKGGHGGAVTDDDEEVPPSSQPWMKGPVKGARTLTSEEIKYNENGPLYLVIIGHVFDVTAGKSYYAPGTGYFGFIGQDGSRAFVSGEFNEKGLVDDIDGLNSQDYLGLANWVKFYFEKYTFVGYHIGRFFDENGQETSYFNKFKTYVKKAESADEEEKDMRKLFPPCNIAWSSETGSRVWCTTQSGGIKRDWVGYPRQFFEAQKDPRCACVHPNLLSDPRVRPYDNCDLKSESCVPPEN